MYRRKGLLDGIPHVGLIWGVIIVAPEGAGKVAAVLEGLGSGVHARAVDLYPEDRPVLGA